MTQPPEKLLCAFQDAFGAHPAFAVRAPGRVDLMGAHVDYNDGFVLPVAVSRDVWIAARACDGPTSIVAHDLDERVTLDGLERGDLPQWARYAAGVAWALNDAGLSTPSIEAVILGRVPMGAGISSSAALEVAFACAWAHLGEWEVEPLALAVLCRKAENEYVGVACGIMDQFASMLGRRDHALLLDCRSLAWESTPLPAGTSLVIADTSTRRRLSDGALNTRYDECMKATEILRESRAEVSALRDVTAADLDELESSLPEPVRSRARHVVDECARVLAAADAMRRGDATEVGELMNRSMHSSRTLYESSGPALDAMWEAGAAHDACLGGRCVGAGFAGCVLFLVRSDAAQDFVSRTSRGFAAATGLTPDLNVVRAADGARVIPL